MPTNLRIQKDSTLHNLLHHATPFVKVQIKTGIPRLFPLERTESWPKSSRLSRDLTCISTVMVMNKVEHRSSSSSESNGKEMASHLNLQKKVKSKRFRDRLVLLITSMPFKWQSYVIYSKKAGWCSVWLVIVYDHDQIYSNSSIRMSRSVRESFTQFTTSKHAKQMLCSFSYWGVSLKYFTDDVCFWMSLSSPSITN